MSATVVGGNMFHSLRERNYTHLTHISQKVLHIQQYAFHKA